MTVKRSFAHMERAGKCVRPGLVIMLPGAVAPVPHRVVKFVHGKRGKVSEIVKWSEVELSGVKWSEVYMSHTVHYIYDN